MYFSMLKLVDRAECSFDIPDCQSAEAEHEWALSLTISQRFELIVLMNQARWGKDAMSRPMGRTRIEILSLEEFDRVKEAEGIVEQAWRRGSGEAILVIG